MPTTIFDHDALFIEWTCASARNRVEAGVDTFVSRDGLIRLQTVRYTLQPR